MEDSASSPTIMMDLSKVGWVATQPTKLPMAELLREAYGWIKMQKRVDAKAAKERDKVTAK